MQTKRAMSIDTIKKIRTFLILYSGVFLFVGYRIKPPTGETEIVPLMDAFAIAGIGTILQLLLWSDWLYWNHLIDKGAKINYKFFQYTGLVITLFTTWIVHMAMIYG